MKYLSVCSGIEAATCAWHILGWEPVGFSEIEPFPSAVLARRFPGVRNYGDMTKYKEWENVGQFDVLVGGTPCQSFSVAGLRKGLNDPRGNLMLVYGAIADHFRPTWIVWENVPGVLSSNGGRDFGSFLGMLGELGYGVAYRVLDAQYFGVAQRRRRVFVVGYLGDWRRAAQVLFESESLSGNPAPSREKREGVTGDSVQCFEPRSPDGHARLIGDIAPTLNRMGGGQREPCICLMDQGGGVMNTEYDITGTLRSQTKGHEPIVMSTGQGNAEITEGHAPTLNCNHEAPVLAISSMTGGEYVGALCARDNKSVGSQFFDEGKVIALAGNTIGRKPENGGNGCGYQEDISYTLTKTDEHGIMQGSTVRRLTPRECERLQGFPDDWTRIPWRGAIAENCPDGPRYKACGNSMAVPVMRWIGKRIIGLTTGST